MAKHAYPNVVRYAPDMLRDRDLQRVTRHYHWWILLGLAFPALLGGIYHQSINGALSGLLWGGLLRMVVLEHIIWSINSLLHTFGSRPYETRENSRNSALLSLVTLGESWHNNHHKFPNSPSFGLAWYRPDPGYWFLCLMAQIGAAKDLRIPKAEAIFSARAEVDPPHAP
jgi:stearoyl-CoA desaturase (delta-9 desaturase)